MKHKRFFSFIIAMIIMLSFCTISPMQTFNSLKAKALTNDEITAKLTALQSQYPSGSYWLTTNTLKYGGYQCYAFARQLAVDVFGSYPAKNIAYATEGEISNGWTAIRNASNVTLEPGDIIRADNDSHSAMIWKIEGNYVYVGQCWGSSNNMLNWGAFWGNNKKATVFELLDSGFTGVWKHPDSTNIINSSVTKPNISMNKSSYAVGETINISWTPSPDNSNLSHYWLIIDAPSGRIMNETMNKNTSYSFVPDEVGDYTIYSYATPKGSVDGEDSLTDSVTIYVSENK